MKNCDYCGAGSPVHAQFCGNCGRLLDTVSVDATAITEPSPPGTPTIATPPFVSDPSYPPVRQQWSQQPGNSQPLYSYNEHEADESPTVLADQAVPFSLAGQAPFPAGNAPVVQGTPQIGGVPSIQNTPPLGQALPGQAPAQYPGSAAPHQPWTWEQQHGEQTYINPAHHSPAQQPITSPHIQHQQHPDHGDYPQPRSSSPEHGEHHEDQHQHGKPQHARKRHFRRLSTEAAASKTMAGVAAKWLIVALTAIIVLVGSGAIIVLTRSPELTLTGSSSVAAGEVLHLHGTGFVPGGTVSLTLDNGLPVGAVALYTYGIASTDVGPGAADVLHLFVAGRQDDQTAAQSSIVVGITGTFDAGVLTQRDWLPGTHTIHATEAPGSRTSSLTFTLLAHLAQVSPTATTPSLSPTTQLGQTPSPTLQPTPSPIVTPTSAPSPTLTPTSAPSPTPTTIPSPTPAPPHPSSLKILGELSDWNGYCQSIGYASATLTGNTAYNWACVSSSGQEVGISTTLACRWQYQDPNAEDLLADYYSTNGWECFTDAHYLGNATDWNGYCQSQGYASATLTGNNAYDWACVSSSGQRSGISVMNLCEWQYYYAQAEGRLVNFNDPNAWECWG
ncbi:MAG TPA: hypothetical protein VKR83_07735 [Ktedonobacteraceae bacterium]|nr:hypothetical protein [Ktedonobacteraceae bacterium]